MDRVLDSAGMLNFDDEKTYSETCLQAVGEVNPSFLDLKHLNYLDLSWNNFSGKSIPKFFGLFHELTYLNLSNAMFGGIVPHHLGNLSSLHSLDLGTNKEFQDYNNIIPSLVVKTLHWTSSLYSLQILDMSGIELTNIPPDSFQAITFFPSLLELRFSQCSLKMNPLPHSSIENFTSLTILDLSWNSFQGPIPSVIQNMTSLKVLRLSQNRFSFNGSILDELKNLNKLEVLDLAANGVFNSIKHELNEYEFPNISSPSIGDNLLELVLSGNVITGYFPNWFPKLRSINVICLLDNYIEGEIPTYFGAFQSLKELYLNLNELSGRIPLSLGKLSNLKTLDLSENRFHGVVSELHFARLSKLKHLSLSKNSLSIKIKSGWVPPFQLKSVRLASCHVGPQYPDWLQSQTGLEVLDMSNTSISDSIPNWFQNLTFLVELDLSGNQIYGNVPNFTRNMKVAYLSSNRFQGSLPPILSKLQILDLSNNKIQGHIQISVGYTFPGLLALSLSNNSISGTIPKSLCKMLFLGFLDFSNNNLSGVFPHCWGNLNSLNVMDLTSNNLSGTIQRSVFHQSMSLESLCLSKNNFHGELPLSLQNCTRLLVLDVSDNNFSGKIPTWIGQSLHYLRILKLSSNKFNGGLSPMLCHLNELQVIDVGSNKLSGYIPRCFGNFSAMLFNQTNYTSTGSYFNLLYEDRLSQVIKGRELEYTKTLRFLTNLDLSNNDFVGKISEQLTNLSGLVSLNLSMNCLTGCIPMKIGQMRSLESLDLSNNHLSGTIPQTISAITTLSYLNLSNNNLSGPIPLGNNQLQTFSDTSYNGNTELCGFPLQKKCTIVDRKEIGKEETDGNENGDGFITIWFYIGMAWGFVVSFWGFCCVLLFKKSWRYAYFQFVNDIVDQLLYAIAKKKV